MMTAAFRAAGFPHTYTPVDVNAHDVLVRAVRFIRDGLHDGANVTTPYKRDVLKLVDEVDPVARRVGAANVLAMNDRGRLCAYNTDVAAIEAEIAGATSARSRVAILGGGGAAAAAIAACKNLEFAVIGVTTRSWGDTETTFEAESAKQVRALGGIAAVWPSGERIVPGSKFSVAMRLQWAELAQQADIVIQATSAGMLDGPNGENVAGVVPFDKMPKETIAYDLVYRPAVTPFLARASGAGLRAISGLGMLVRQAEASYRLWMKEDPPAGAMRRAAAVVIANTTVNDSLE